MAAEAKPDSSSSGFEIDGKTYEIPRFDTITLDEERVLYIYADVVLSDFAPAPAEATPEERRDFEAMQWRKIRNPEFKRALAHIAYRRENRDVADADIRIAVGSAKANEVDLALLRGDAEDPPLPTSQKPPESKSDTSEPSRPTDSGRPTANGSDPVAETPEGTGTTELATSSPGVVPIASVS